MRITLRVALVVALLCAGCLAKDAPRAPTTSASPSPMPRTATVTYQCPGGTASTRPCGREIAAAGLYGIQDLVLRSDPPLVVAVGTSPASGTPTPAGTADPGFAVAVSSDGGGTWDLRPLPSVATPSTRTGSSTALFAAMAWAPDGALVVGAMLASDPERNLVGGNIMPGPLQTRHDIAAYVSRDEGRSWTTQLLSVGTASYYVDVTTAGNLTLVTWSDAPAGSRAFRAAASRDLETWSNIDSSIDCSQRSEALAVSGRILLACIAEASGTDFTGPVKLMEVRPEARLAVEIGLLANETLTCGRVQLVPLASRSLLVASGCPGIEVLSSADGTEWSHQAQTDPQALGTALGQYGEEDLVSAELDASGRLHAILERNSVSRVAGQDIGCCYDTAYSHLVLDPADGRVLHQATLSQIAVDPTTGDSLARQIETYSGGTVAIEGNAGWLAWAAEPPKVGSFTVGP